MTLESDKATMDVPSPAAGKITELIAKVGDKVSMGALIAKLDAGGPARRAQGRAEAKEEEDAAEAPQTSPVAPRDLPPVAPGSGPAKADFSGVFAGPAVRRLARTRPSPCRRKTRRRRRRRRTPPGRPIPRPSRPGICRPRSARVPGPPRPTSPASSPARRFVALHASSILTSTRSKAPERRAASPGRT